MPESTYSAHIRVAIPKAALLECNLAPAQLVDDCHLTILHLGRGIRAESMRAFESSWLGEAPSTPRIRCEVTGVGEFYLNRRTPVLLFNSSDLVDQVRPRLRAFARGAGIALEDKYGFIPHVTLAPNVSPFHLHLRKKKLLIEEIELVVKNEDTDVKTYFKTALRGGA